MGYFPNMTSWECWAANNCFRCSHWPKGDEEPGCPVDMAHTLYSYELCNEDDHPGKIILDLLIPPGKLDNKRCAMFSPRNGVSDKHLKDWAKYKAIMAEAASGIAARSDETAEQAQPEARARPDAQTPPPSGDPS